MSFSEESLATLTTNLEAAFSDLLRSIATLRASVEALVVVASEASRIASRLAPDSAQEATAKSVSAIVTSTVSSLGDITGAVSSLGESAVYPSEEADNPEEPDNPE